MATKNIARQIPKKEERPIRHNKIVDDGRTYTESEILDNPPGEPPKTPSRRMTLDDASQEELELTLIPPQEDPYKTLAWTASGEEFVRYTGSYRGKSIIMEVGQVDLALFAEAGDYYYQVTYSILQKGELWCNTGALPLRKLNLLLLDKGDALVLTIPVNFRIHGQRHIDTGPIPIRSKLYTPVEVWARTVATLASVPPSFEVGWMIPPK